MRVWLLKADGGTDEMLPERPGKPLPTPEQIVIPAFDPDPTVEEFSEIVYHRYSVMDGDRLVGYVYSAHEPSPGELDGLTRR